MPTAPASPEPFEAPPPEVIYWQWVSATAVAGVVSAILSYVVAEVLFAGPPPKPLISDILRTLSDSVPMALAQATVLWRAFRTSRAAYTLLTVLPMLLISAPMVARLFDGPETAEVTGATTMATVLNPTVVLVSAVLGIIVAAPLAMAFAGLQWLAMRNRVTGLGTWLFWNAAGYSALTLGLFAAVTIFGAGDLFNFTGRSGSSVMFAITPIAMVIANALAGVGVASLKLKPGTDAGL